MQEKQRSLESNPARVLVVRLIACCIGGLLVYAALPSPLEVGTWWDRTSLLPFLAGIAVLALAVFAPARWCELLIA